MQFSFSRFAVTTWRVNENGEQVWRARKGPNDDTDVAEFTASRDAPIDLLEILGRQALWPEGAQHG